MALMLLKPLCYYTHSSSYESKLLRYIHSQRKHKLGEVCSQCGEDHSARNTVKEMQRVSTSSLVPLGPLGCRNEAKVAAVAHP